MSTPNVPFKTSLGQDELRTRTHRLSQRHRTILLLVDGRRPLAEVLSLAQQAGSSISHFEEVLRMGLVELPIDVVAPDPVMTEPGALATLRTTAVEVEVATPTDAPDSASPEPVESLPMMSVRTPDAARSAGGRSATTDDSAMLPAALMVVEDEAVAAHALATEQPAPPTPPSHPSAAQPPAPAPASVADAPAPPTRAAPPVLADAVVMPAVPVAQTKPAKAAPPAPAAAPQAPELPAFPPPSRTGPAAPATQRLRGAARPSRPSAPARPEPVTLSELADVPAPEFPPPPVATPDDALVEQVRALLSDTVRQNPPPFVSRVPARLSAARTLQELRDLVLNIERYLSARRPRAGVAGLQQARELLGLGNTVVAEDSRPWHDEDDDEPDAFRTTR